MGFRTALWALALATAVAACSSRSVEVDGHGLLPPAFHSIEGRVPALPGPDFAASEGGFSAAGSLHRSTLPGAAHLPVTLEAGGAALQITEEGAEGEAERVTGRVVRYRGRGVTRLWVALENGLEEWLVIEAPQGERVASWRVEGGALHQRGDTVEILSSNGAGPVVVSAPEAFGPGGEKVGLRLTAEGDRVVLHAAHGGRGPLLIDPLWQAGGTLVSARSEHSASDLPSGKVLLAGGWGPCCPRDILATAELYDPSTNASTAVAAMPTARTRHTATKLSDNTILVAGGLSTGDVTKNAEIFNPATNAWKAAGALANGRSNHTATLLSNGSVLVAGGVSNTFLSLGTAEVYNPSLNSWSSTFPMNTARGYHVAVRLANNTVLVAGGNDGNQVLSSAETYSTGLSNWTTTGAMTVRRQNHVATLLANGKVLVTGGSNDTGVLASAELFDSASGTWTATGSMAFARKNHVAVLLPSGKVLVAGGQDLVGMVTKAEVWDPATGKWSSAGCLATARAFPTASVLSTGKVLVAGGTSSGTDSLSSTELHDPAGAFVNGAACTSDCQCASELCVDGVCCDKACGGACDACNLTGSVGTCTVVAKGAAGAPSCSPYLCGGASASCPSTCAVDGDCVASHWCSGTTCIPRKTNGATCSIARECLSGNCIDGVCCDTACGGACDACNLSGALGTCTARPAGDPGTPNCSPYLCSGASAACATTCSSDAACVSTHYCDAGACALKKPNGQTCAGNNECQSARCVDGFCCNATCGGACDACNVKGAEGTCTLLTKGAAGTPSCAPYLCSGAAPACPGTCTLDGDCVATHYCNGSTCTLKKPNGLACAGDRECGSAHCVDGVCCDTACNGACDACNLSGSSGTCSNRAAGAAGSPACSPYLCGGADPACPSTCASDAGCVSTHYCASNACVQKKPQGATCAADRECATAHCVDGLCCNTGCGGACDVCNLASAPGTCSPATAGSSGSPGCNPYLCNGASSACPTSCTDDALCAAGFFCGNGACVPKKGNGETCRAQNECSSGFCIDGFCCDTACGGSCDACNVQGALGVCTSVAAGRPGSPACVPYLCSGTQATCPSSCSADAGCVSTHYCDASLCVPKKGNGETCTASRECATGNCIDGVCCDTACGGACDACNLTGSPGTCSPVTAGASGTPACSPYLCDGAQSACPSACTTDAGCAAGFFCGSGHCIPTKTNGETCKGANECASAFCVDGFCCDTACNGACDACNLLNNLGVCSTVPAGRAGSPACAPYLCDGAAASCPSTCSSDAQCVASHFCSAGTCIPRKGNGETCTADGDCASAHCVDGFCCNTACTEACAACDVAGSEGTCSPSATGSPGSPACAPYLCGGGLKCPTSCTTDAGCVTTSYCSFNACVPKKPAGELCRADNECGSGHCVDGVCCDTACNGACDACNLSASLGTCTPLTAGAPGTPSCMPYVCSGADGACPSGCTTDAACAQGFFCSMGACIPKLTNGAPCLTATQCASNVCASGVCCDKACGGACESCALLGSTGVCTSLPAGSYGSPTCAPFVCTGGGTCPGTCATDSECVPGDYCKSGSCVPKLPDGGACTGDRECANGRCVDGFCCNSACAGACDACNLPGLEGKCSPSPAKSPGSPSCSPYLCDGTSPSCPNTCAKDADCEPGSICKGGRCVKPHPNGDPCQEKTDCVSGFCVDGVCCDTICKDACLSCAVKGKEGTCTTVAAGSTGRPSCAPYQCDGVATTCPSTCTRDGDCVTGFVCVDGTCQPKKDNGKGCRGDHECGSGHCIDAVCCDTTCDGACDACNLPGSEGTCKPLPQGALGSPSCAPLTCDGVSPKCPPPCQTNADCGDGLECSAGACVPLVVDAGTELPHAYVGFGCGCEASGGEATPLGWLAVGLLFLLKRRSKRTASAAIALAALVPMAARTEPQKSLPEDALALRTVQAVAPEGPAPEPAATVAGNASAHAPSKLDDLHVAANVFGETVAFVLSRQLYVGGEVGLSYSVLRWLDLGALANLGDHVGARVTGALHPARTIDTQLAPFVQARFALHPVPGGLGLGGGAWAGGSYELGPGRFQGGIMGEGYKGPPGYYPFAVVAMVGYELDPFRGNGRDRIVERVVVQEKVVEKVVEKEIRAPAPTTATLRTRVVDLDDHPLKGTLTLASPGQPEQKRAVAEEQDLVLTPGVWQLTATAEGFLSRGRTLTVRAGDTLVVEFALRPVPKQSSAELTKERIEIKQAIRFELNDARILADSHGVLDEVTDILLKNPTLQIRVEGHTDETGGADYNQRLSEKRATSVEAYLVEHGIPAARLTSKGFGSARPLAPNGSEEGRAVNRRVQFVILSPGQP